MVGGATPSTSNFGSADLIGAKSPILNRYSLVAPQTLHLPKKVQLTLIGRPLRFPMSLRWSSYVAPEPSKGAQKRKTAVFRVKSHFAWMKKVCCINSARGRHGYVLEHRFTKFSEITQCNSHYSIQGHSRSPILVPVESSYATFYLWLILT